MDFRCTTPKYDRLYARWLANPGTLLDLAEYQPGQRVLDLCGGTGAVTMEALRRGADPSTLMLVDLNPRCPDTRVKQVRGDVDDLGRTVFGSRQPGCLKSFDLIVIRQAAAYLRWDIFFVLWLRGLLNPGGKMVFNTFSKPPRSSLRSYTYGGVRYLEGSVQYGGTIWHVQASPSIGVDVSRFKVTPREYLEGRLDPVFKFQVFEEEKSLRWVCSPRERVRVGR